MIYSAYQSAGTCEGKEMLTMKDIREFLETIGRMSPDDLHGVLRAQRAQSCPENEIYAELTRRELLERENT